MKALRLNAGFTLIEVMVSVALVGITASVVVMALPGASSLQQGREQLARLADTFALQRSEAMAQGTLIGLFIQTHGYQFRRQAASGWQTPPAAETAFTDAITLKLTQKDLLLDEAASGEGDDPPQLLLFPGGEVTAFTLTAFVHQQPAATLSVTDEGDITLLDIVP
ncbi:MAG: type II secretion system minor pseudopilin GspH [Silvania sp.]|uniref:type II secretion system minor pseudopilin GspH n=1 Tax=Silvania sp. TaxID=3016633 RepID=UPI003EE4AF69